MLPFTKQAVQAAEAFGLRFGLGVRLRATDMRVIAWAPAGVVFDFLALCCLLLLRRLQLQPSAAQVARKSRMVALLAEVRGVCMVANRGVIMLLRAEFERSKVEQVRHIFQQIQAHQNETGAGLSGDIQTAQFFSAEFTTLAAALAPTDSTVAEMTETEAKIGDERAAAVENDGDGARPTSRRQKSASSCPERVGRRSRNGSIGAESAPPEVTAKKGVSLHRSRTTPADVPHVVLHMVPDEEDVDKVEAAGVSGEATKVASDGADATKQEDDDKKADDAKGLERDSDDEDADALSTTTTAKESKPPLMQRFSTW